ncbi:cobalamin B12-binding domain-containing protein [Burkholderia territorii]|uniref:Methylmalonyl-CoA mutase n=1 Tax=Burkholderia territorii TaxID=1503055 RepID=A0A6P2LST1_9BURK|nr:cobalamin-dependent protein [Burkholderia territorii]KAB0686475.1 methylmalonyl-CoA mutase [Burkholderia territorii]MBM2775685.1 cobalamin-dependent protein [Burkholderia territorii]VWB69984.1 Glutamate mutase sigma subunit [Burkholderia territorii]
MSRSAPCIVATIESDSHMWNLVFMQLWLKEQGFDVVNLGCCTPPDLLLETIAREAPCCVIVSTVNGHGHFQARQLIERVRRQYPTLPCFVGGKLTTSEATLPEASASLLAAGFSAVLTGADALARCKALLAPLRSYSAALPLVA